MLWIAADCLPIEVGEHVLPQLFNVARVDLYSKITVTSMRRRTSRQDAPIHESWGST